MNPWLLDILACPRHHTRLTPASNALTCPDGCSFPVLEDVPVMLLEEAQETMGVAQTSLRQAKEPSTDGGLYVESLGLTEQQKQAILQLAASNNTGVDPVVSYLVSATNGVSYGSIPFPICVCRHPMAKPFSTSDAVGVAGALPPLERVTRSSASTRLWARSWPRAESLGSSRWKHNSSSAMPASFLLQTPASTAFSPTVSFSI